MPLEIATYIEDLIATNPVGGTDQVSSADDHLRLIKSTLKTTMPGFGGRIKRVDTRSSNFVASLAHNHVMFRCTSVLTVTLTSPATIGNGCEYVVFNDASPAGTITVTPAAGTINGLASLAVPTGMAAYVWCDGNNYYAIRVVITAGTMAQQDASSVNITGGNIAVAAGGTGANTAAGARTNLGLGSVALLNSIATANLDNDAVTQDKIANAAVGQDQLKTLIGTVSGKGSFTLPGGQYGFWLEIRHAAGTGTTASARVENTSTTFGAIVTLTEGAPTAANPEVRQRYIQASPPYESYRPGDQIPIFIFALVDKTTNAVVATYVAEDPPWANNGPTIINPIGYTKQLIRKEFEANVVGFEAWADLETWIQEEINFKKISEALQKSIPQERKNADMMLIPHPFNQVDTSRYQIVVVNPTCDRLCCAIHNRFVYGGDSISEMLHDGFFILDNTPMPGLITPNSVMPVRARLR